MAARNPFRRSLWQRLHLSFDVFQNKTLDALDALQPTSVVDMYSDTKKKRRACLGDLRTERIRQLLNSGFGVTRSKMQVSFHEAFLAACRYVCMYGILDLDFFSTLCYSQCYLFSNL